LYSIEISAGITHGAAVAMASCIVLFLLRHSMILKSLKRYLERLWVALINGIQPVVRARRQEPALIEFDLAFDSTVLTISLNPR
jgi:hypothetical protein